MLQRRLMVSGLIAAPAIVRVSSMMPLSIITHKITPSPLLTGEYEMWMDELGIALDKAIDASRRKLLFDVVDHLETGITLMRRMTKALHRDRALGLINQTGRVIGHATT